MELAANHGGYVVTDKGLKNIIVVLFTIMSMLAGGIWLGINSKALPTNGGATATAEALSATVTATPTTTQTATTAETATPTPLAMAETATAVARQALYYKERVDELELHSKLTATREAKWQKDSRNARQEADRRLRDAGCYERPCVLVTWGSGYDRWSSVVANGISVADGGNSIFLSKVSVSWDNYDRPERVVVKPSDRTTRDGEPYAVWVRITANGELQLTELPVEEIYGN